MPARRISAKEARASFGDLIGSVYYTREPVIIERKGRPFAVMISPEQYEIVEKRVEEAWSTIDRIRESNKDKDPEEVLRDITRIVEQVREERHSRRVKTARGRS